MSVEFPENQLVGRGVFTKMIQQKYPMLSLYCVKKAIERNVTPERIADYCLFGQKQWDQAVTYFETRSTRFKRPQNKIPIEELIETIARRVFEEMQNKEPSA